MAPFDNMLVRWQAALSPRIPRAAVARFLAEEGPELRQQFELAARAVRERRSVDAFQRWLDQQALAGRDFDEAQLHWLDTMRRDIAAAGTLSIERLNQEPYRARGGEDKAVRLFGRRTLGEVVSSLNAALGTKPAGCGCGCGGTRGVKAGCGCGAPKPRTDAPPESHVPKDTSMSPADILRAAGLELLEGSLYTVGTLTVYRPPTDDARRRALDAFARSGVPTKIHNGQVVVRHHPARS